MALAGSRAKMQKGKWRVGVAGHGRERGRSCCSIPWPLLNTCRGNCCCWCVCGRCCCLVLKKNKNKLKKTKIEQNGMMMSQAVPSTRGSSCLISGAVPLFWRQRRRRRCHLSGNLSDSWEWNEVANQSHIGVGYGCVAPADPSGWHHQESPSLPTVPAQLAAPWEGNKLLTPSQVQQARISDGTFISSSTVGEGNLVRGCVL